MAMGALLNSAELKTPGPKKRNYPRRISTHFFYTEAEKNYVRSDKPLAER